jgi:hypothetical protein
MDDQFFEVVKLALVAVGGSVPSPDYPPRRVAARRALSFQMQTSCLRVCMSAKRGRGIYCRRSCVTAVACRGADQWVTGVPAPRRNRQQFTLRRTRHRAFSRGIHDGVIKRNANDGATCGAICGAICETSLHRQTRLRGPLRVYRRLRHLSGARAGRCSHSPRRGAPIYTGVGAGGCAAGGTHAFTDPLTLAADDTVQDSVSQDSVCRSTAPGAGRGASRGARTTGRFAHPDAGSGRRTR